MRLPVYRYTLHPPLFYNMDQKRTRQPPPPPRAQVLLYHPPLRGASNVSLAMFYVSRGGEERVSRPFQRILARLDSRPSASSRIFSRARSATDSSRTLSPVSQASSSLTFSIGRIGERWQIKFQPCTQARLHSSTTRRLSISSWPQKWQARSKGDLRNAKNRGTEEAST